MSNFENIMSKGIPVDSFISISLEEIYELCGDNEKAKQSIVNNIRNVRKYFFDTYGITVSYIMPMESISIFVDPLTLKKDFYFSESNIFDPFILLLDHNETRNILEDQYYEHSFIENKLKDLNFINNENDLRKRFPRLYNIYINQKETYKLLAKVYTKLESETGFKALEIRKELIDEITKDGCDHTYEEMKEVAFSFNIEYFCKEVVRTINIIFSHLTDILDYLQTFKIKLNYFTRDIKEKMQVLVLYYYLRMLSREFILDIDKQKALYYVMDCFKEMDTAKISTEKVLIPGENKEVSYKELYNMYKKVLLDNPSLQLINFSDVDFSTMTKEEIEEFTCEYVKDLSVSWEIIPNHKSNPTSESIKKIKNEISKSNIDKQKQLEHLLDKLIEKKEFYGSINPVYMVRGINKFSGYFACIMPNGIVILDKYYENAKSKRLTKGDAIYIMRLDQFFVLSHYDKTYLYGNKLCKRRYHTNGWQENVQSYITDDSIGINTVEEIKKLLNVCQEYIN